MSQIQIDYRRGVFINVDITFQGQGITFAIKWQSKNMHNIYKDIDRKAFSR